MNEDHNNAYLRDYLRTQFASIAKRMFNTSFFGSLLKSDKRDEIVERSKAEIEKEKLFYTNPFYYNFQECKYVDDFID